MKELEYLEKFENLWYSFVKNKVVKRGKNTLSLYIDFEEFNVVIKARVGKNGSIKIFVFVFYKENKKLQINRVFICKEFGGIHSGFFTDGMLGGHKKLYTMALAVGKLTPKYKDQQESLRYVKSYLDFLLLVLNTDLESFRKYLNILNLD